MHRGFVPLYRKTKENWVYNDCNRLGAWCKILMEVNHKPTKTEIQGELITCDRGQSINSLETWRKVFGKGWSIQNVRTFFKLLQSDSMIIVEGLRKTTRLTVCNYESYNNSQQTTNTQLTHSQHTANTQLTTNNNDNNEKNDKNNNFNFKKSLLDLGVESNTVRDWLLVRKTKKATNTETSFKNIANQINKSSITADECIKLAIYKDWKGFNASWVAEDDIKEMKKENYVNDNKLTNEELDAKFN